MKQQHLTRMKIQSSATLKTGHQLEKYAELILVILGNASHQTHMVTIVLSPVFS